jgi:glycosyltransferase involved in cell wall biosynthesis
MLRLHGMWRSFHRESRKACARISAQQGPRKKSAEAIRIGVKAWTRLLNNLKAPIDRPAVGAPLDRAVAHRAMHLLRAYRLWFERIRTNGLADVPPLDLLHGELLQDPLKRRAYPVYEFPAPERPTVSVVIPVRDQCEITYRCLCSLLFAYNDTEFEVIVVDDGSSDETTMLGDFVRGIKVVRHALPQGLARAVDHGAVRARGEFVLVLDSRSEVTARWLDELVAVFRNFDRVGAASSKTVFPDGKLQECARPAKEGTWHTARGRDADAPAYDYLQKVDCVSGAAVMVPRALWEEVGGFGEDLASVALDNIAVKVRARGRFVVFVPTSVVYVLHAFSVGLDVANEGNPDNIIASLETRRKNPNRASEAAFRVLFIEQQFPLVDSDAGSYAAFQEMRLLQALGAEISFLPRNLVWMGRHSVALQRIGVECLFAPYVNDFPRYIRRHAREYDLVYVARHELAEQVIPLVRETTSSTKIAFNLADLHFLREQREAALGSDGHSRARAAETQRKELAIASASDLTFSYSDVELGILASEVIPGTRLARMPWVVDTRPRTIPYPETRDILFLGGFAHPPNAAAVSFFARNVMPLLRKRLPATVFNVVGSGAEDAVSELASDHVRIIGHVANLSDCLERARVFVAPLLAGAGIKGKVLDALSHGVPSVLSPIAAEGTGLVHGIDCLIAESAEAWAECIFSLYVDESLWARISTSALRTAELRFSFARGASDLEKELAELGLASRREWGMPYLFARPDRYEI